MTFVHVAIQQIMHTCPASPEPHAIDTRRVIVGLVLGGPCRQPIAVRVNNTAVLVACGRRLPRDRRCPACRITVIERDIVTIDLGYQGPQRPTTSGTAA